MNGSRGSWVTIFNPEKIIERVVEKVVEVPAPQPPQFHPIFAITPCTFETGTEIRIVFFKWLIVLKKWKIFVSKSA